MPKNRIELIQGDITHQQVEAIVNAANSSLLGGGGVDGAIHRAAGPDLLEECRTLGGCTTGAAKVTKGYNLAAAWVIHTVGPVWKGGSHNEDRLLADCYKNCLTLATDYQVHSIAFPSISTGAYGFPVEQAAVIAVNETINYIERNELPHRVIFVCFDTRTLQAYLKAMESMEKAP